jgi:hypothetical protein
MSFTFKVSYLEDTRRFTVDPSVFGYAELIPYLRSLFGNLPEIISLKYIDDEQDLITITSDIEFQECLHLKTKVGENIARLFIFSKREFSHSSILDPSVESKKTKEAEKDSTTAKIREIIDNVLQLALLNPQMFRQSLEEFRDYVNKEEPKESEDVNSLASLFQGLGIEKKDDMDDETISKFQKEGSILDKFHTFFKSKFDKMMVVSCDNCNSVIEGIRHKCNECLNYVHYFYYLND